MKNTLKSIWFFHKHMFLVIQSEEPVKQVVLRYQSNLLNRQQKYPFIIRKRKTHNQGEIVWLKIDLQQLEYQTIYWDILVENKDNEEFFVDVGKCRNLIRFPLYDGKIVFPNGSFFHPFITRERTLAFQYRERTREDKRIFRVKELMALIIYVLLKPYWSRRNIYLIYEKFCKMAQDNSYYLFCYCMDHHIEEKWKSEIYYVIDRSAPDYEKVQQYGKNVISFMSLRHKVYLLAAKLLISTDTKKHAYAWRCRMSFIEHMVRRKKLVFLQHGVTSFKRVDRIYGKGNFGECNLFIVTSDKEKELVKKYFGYLENEIAVTGFARWDVLKNKNQDQKNILMMPTWRNWLEETDEDTFRKSQYYKTYMDFLSSKELEKILEKYDLQLQFYLHPKFREYISEFQVKKTRIHLISFGQLPLNELMMECQMLITDYSSVAWDVFYLGKPVLFFQFDMEEYLEAHGSYIDFQKDLFGKRAVNSQQLLNMIKDSISSDFKIDDNMEMKRKQLFKYIDHNNCKRIVEAVVEMKLT